MDRGDILKFLILSHNPVTTYDAMGKTMATLFAEFDKKELCQLYIYPTIPDIDFCDSYYRVTDKDVLNSYFKFKVNGREIAKSEIDTSSHSMFENPEDEAKYRNRKNKTAVRMLLRDIMWRFSSWYNKDLKEWLKEQAPTCIFVAPGSAKFFYDMALKISKDFKIPIVTYICDEYYFLKSPKGLLEKIRIMALQKKIAGLMKKTSHIITICDSLSELYSNEFSVPSTVIMTGTSYDISQEIAPTANKKAITYMGNIRCNRFNSLAEIGRELKNINDEKGTDFLLNIYTAEKDETILSTFDGIDTIKLCGYVGGEEFDRVFHSADILLHTEAFDEKSIDSVKNSVSTKIADSLASGICMFAYGPENVASMQHLIKNKCAVVATSRESLKSMLETLFLDENARINATQNALKTAAVFHNSQINSKKLYEIMEKVNEDITG